MSKNIDRNLLVDFFYLPARQVGKTHRRPQPRPDDTAARKAQIKAIQNERGCSFMEARRAYLAQ